MNDLGNFKEIKINVSNFSNVDKVGKILDLSSINDINTNQFVINNSGNNNNGN